MAAKKITLTDEHIHLIQNIDFHAFEFGEELPNEIKSTGLYLIRNSHTGKFSIYYGNLLVFSSIPDTASPDILGGYIKIDEPDKNGRVYNPDSVKIPDNINNSLQFIGVYDELPKVGKDGCICAVFDKILNRYKTYIYNSSSSEWIEIGEILTEEEEKEAELKLKLKREDLKLRLEELKV
jgi:hypothetical protein